jgi:hypothetical protein
MYFQQGLQLSAATGSSFTGAAPYCLLAFTSIAQGLHTLNSFLGSNRISRTFSTEQLSQINFPLIYYI